MGWHNINPSSITVVKTQLYLWINGQTAVGGRGGIPNPHTYLLSTGIFPELDFLASSRPGLHPHAYTYIYQAAPNPTELSSNTAAWLEEIASS